MTRTQWTSLVTIVFGSMLTTMSCEEQTVSSIPAGTGNGSQNSASGAPISARVLNYTFDGKEGDPLPLSEATAWAANYANERPLSPRAHFFGSAILKEILASNSCMGIRIFYSLDGDGKQELLLVGADEAGKNIRTKDAFKGRTSFAALDDSKAGGEVFEGTEGDPVGEEESVSWLANYTASESRGLIAHFFGREILNQILDEDGCVGIRMYYALNNAGVQQVLLVGVTSEGENLMPDPEKGGRTSGGNTIGDASSPCPSYCP